MVPRRAAPVPLAAVTAPFSPPTAAAPALAGRATESLLACLSASVEGGLAYWAGALERRAGPLELLDDGLRFTELTARRRPPRWSSPHEIVFETELARLRDFSAGSRARVAPTLVLPPQAGHDSCIVDYSERQSQLQTIRAAGLTRLWSLDWVGATAETKDAGIEDYLAVVDRAAEAIGGKLNVVGDCQGGWLATIWAALRPERVNTLTIAGAPIDFHAGGAVIADWVARIAELGGMAFYRGVVAEGGGVLRGEHILNGFVGIKPENELAKRLQLLANLHDERHVERYRDFEDWYAHGQDIAGRFYLWIVEHLFHHNRLIRGELEIGGEIVDLGRLSAPLNLLAGAEDHITPPAQVFALADAVSTPRSRIAHDTTSGGHLGLFMGHAALRDHWPPLLARVLAHSRRRPRPAAAERRSRARTPSERREIPAP
jgi:poly(3-hydroxybutyrate) depolymerase